MIKELSQLFIRDLEKLKSEIQLYKNQENLWVIDGNIKNSGGNLALHIIGNLNHFIGHVLCKTDYIRDREAEFNAKSITIGDMLFLIDSTIKMFSNEFLALDPDKMNESYPINVIKGIDSTKHFIFHLLGHLGYHLGQLNYHRRLLDE